MHRTVRSYDGDEHAQSNINYYCTYKVTVELNTPTVHRSIVVFFSYSLSLSNLLLTGDSTGVTFINNFYLNFKKKIIKR